MGLKAAGQEANGRQKDGNEPGREAGAPGQILKPGLASGAAVFKNLPDVSMANESQDNAW